MVNKYFRVHRTRIVVSSALGILLILGAALVLFAQKQPTYASAQYGYGISYPAEWAIDSSRTDFPIDVIKQADEEALIFIDIANDPALINDRGRFILERSIRESFKSNERYEMESFETKTFKGNRGFKVTGTRLDIPRRENAGQDDATLEEAKNVRWRFEQHVIFAGKNSPIMYNITISVREDKVGEHLSTAQDIFASLKIPKP